MPFLIAGAALGSSTSLLKKLGPYMQVISIASGILIIFVGMLILLDRVAVLNDNFTFLPSAADDAASTSGNITGLFGFGVAFLGGFLSFLSPCVLPLVPIYLTHLAGESANEMAAAREDAGLPPAGTSDVGDPETSVADPDASTQPVSGG